MIHEEDGILRCSFARATNQMVGHDLHDAGI
jgi:hypothetical protein